MTDRRLPEIDYGTGFGPPAHYGVDGDVHAGSWLSKDCPVCTPWLPEPEEEDD